MRILKWILIGIAAIIAIPLLSALFISNDYWVEREIVINKPREEVFAYIKSLKNQSNWSTWEKMDPNMKHEYKGTDGTVGFVHRWEGNPDNVGTGEQEIKKITENQRVDFELRFYVPMESHSPAWITTETVEDTKTRVVWGMSGSMPYPFNFMQVFVSMDQMIGTEYARSLNNLRGILEKQ